jgi:proteasome lid subunit RPN8/RPN11
MSECLVSISDQAFFTIVTAALEAYKIDHADPESEEPKQYLETFGNLWGYYSQSGFGEDVFRVVMADVSTSAERGQDFVIDKEECYEAKKDFVSVYYPELSFLGDYHSHPYTTPTTSENGAKTELDLERNELYRFSNTDFRSVKYQQQAGRNYRVGIVATVYERDEGISRPSKHIDEASCIRFQYNNMTIWLKAYVWAGEDYRRKADKMVHLMCPNLGFNAC